MTRIQYLLTVLIAITLAGAPAPGQQADHPQDNGDFMSRPTEYGFVLTPSLARAIAGGIVEEFFVREHELDKEKANEARELIARRIMQTAHNLDTEGSELIERFMEEMVGRRQEEHSGFLPPAFGKEFAGRLLPMLPEIRNLIGGVISDVRPMLPMKQQLKLAGEVLALNTAIDGLEQTMTKWSSGEITEFNDPFSDNRIHRDEQGVSIPLKRARQQAETSPEQQTVAEWKSYVEQAKEFYEFDDTQSASADSLLREYTDRINSQSDDGQRSARLYRNNLWRSIIWSGQLKWKRLFYQMLEQKHTELITSSDALADELKQRIDRIPTEAQRKAAEQRMNDLLAEKGFKPPDDEAVAQ